MRGIAVVVSLAIMATVPPAGAAPGTITVENVDSLGVVARWDLGPEPVYYGSAIDWDDWYLMVFATPDDRARLFRIDLDSGRIPMVDRSPVRQRQPGGRPRHRALCGSGLFPLPGAAHNCGPRRQRQDDVDRRGGLGEHVGPIVILSRFQTPASGHFTADTWAVQAASGRRLWRYRSPGAVSRFHTPIVARDALYLLDDDDLVAMDPRTGDVRWRLPGPRDGQGLWDADAHGPYVARTPGIHSMLLALDGETGARPVAGRRRDRARRSAMAPRS